ncbi:MAG: hypothetical protein ACOC0M_03205 [Halomonas sp.]
MNHVHQTGDGRIELVSREASADCREFLSADSPELLAFLMEGEARKGHAYRRRVSPSCGCWST